MSHPSTQPLHEPTWTIQPPKPADEHPVRCPARLSVFAFVLDPNSSAHTHECIHPAKRPISIEGLLVHLCHCGATWTERSSAGGTKTSNEEQA